MLVGFKWLVVQMLCLLLLLFTVHSIKRAFWGELTKHEVWRWKAPTLIYNSPVLEWSIYEKENFLPFLTETLENVTVLKSI